MATMPIWRWSWVIALLLACGDDSGAMTDAGIDGADSMPDAPGFIEPTTLAETGLCADAACTQINAGIQPYAPRFELYSDGATKKRWISLPPGTTIDTSNMDHWSFPVGTKLWKEFSRGGTRVETRLEMRIGPGDTQDDWFYAAYVWNAAQNETTWAEFGQVDANGTQHDVPSKLMCRQCHENNRPSRVLGFSAIQLDLDGAAGELDLVDTIAAGWLSNPPAGSSPYFPLPADGTYAHAALGYLHANCGHCHNPSSNTSANTPVTFRLTVGTLGTLAGTPTYTTAVNVTTANTVNGHDTIVKPGQPDQSVLIDRFESGAANLKMPQIGTELVDMDAQTVLRTWITDIP
jgi:hypothetical protein